MADHIPKLIQNSRYFTEDIKMPNLDIAHNSFNVVHNYLHIVHNWPNIMHSLLSKHSWLALDIIEKQRRN